MENNLFQIFKWIHVVALKDICHPSLMSNCNISTSSCVDIAMFIVYNISFECNLIFDLTEDVMSLTQQKKNSGAQEL